ncbi:phage tail assembly protein [Paraburkholderia caballeronis]|uniref:Phage tail assembly chaperone protein, E, or 41 or 14 n=1 Tax=Paraburkholderia caballeronis TaxID=416943 RepID=A0A1H7TYI9_9BURK|nr:phage tail assembly protein [Paraburkholderia caballeronis]PXW23410.1 tail assembly chaperone E/41/14-like protein [Paraburkholderia caballeronis]PXW98403.1 tail assembly chaperone E/41/14-like protein [Paraburkholderia caballeronis]RAJ95134.1 tail assembly chaperone E/41/14-like protein [Paraburkholderia caballeronis]SEC55121.1 Phage tail assembly chaperone protein, E, or 41 or 14 [Paraburkholderia caballeronis]SEL89942.1 Phage tail assembly chaperone protein, E, or 41 or 14 [Paraburkholde
MDDEKIIRFKNPITLKGDSVTYESITLREPTVDELDRSAQIEGSVYAANAALISFVAGVPLPVVRKMGKTDYEEATAFLSGFTWQPPQPGATSETAAQT